MMVSLTSVIVGKLETNIYVQDNCFARTGSIGSWIMACEGKGGMRTITIFWHKSLGERTTV